MVAYDGSSGSDVVLFGALASNEAKEDPIDLAFLNSEKEKGVEMSLYRQEEFTPFDASTRMTKAAVSDGKGEVPRGQGGGVSDF